MEKVALVAVTHFQIHIMSIYLIRQLDVPRGDLGECFLCCIAEALLEE